MRAMTSMIRSFGPFAFCSLMALCWPVQGLAAQSVRAENADKAAEDRYIECLNMADLAPDRAIDMALAWVADGGGVPARHCEALALAKDGDYAEAAIRLERLVEDMRIGRDMPIIAGERLTADAAFLSEVYAQAANAWLLADDSFRAMDAIDAAVTLATVQSAAELQYRVDRARIAAADEDFSLALTDLTYVQRYDPGRKDILLLIGSAARALGQFKKALAALDAYDLVFKDDPVSVLERAHLMESEGKIAKARKLYLRVTELSDNASLIEIARANIERLDLEVD